MTKRYASAKGRAHRKEFWGFNIFATVILFIALVIDIIVILPSQLSSGDVQEYGEWLVFRDGTPWVPGLLFISFLALLAPTIGVTSRRAHDLGYSGWIAAATAIPVVGGLIAFFIGLPAGNKGDNAYGPDPLAGGPA